MFCILILLFAIRIYPVFNTLLTPTVATFLPLIFYIFSRNIPDTFPDTVQNIRPSKKYVLSRNVSVDNPDIFSKYDMLYNSSSDLLFY